MPYDLWRSVMIVSGEEDPNKKKPEITTTDDLGRKVYDPPMSPFRLENIETELYSRDYSSDTSEEGVTLSDLERFDEEERSKLNKKRRRRSKPSRIAKLKKRESKPTTDGKKIELKEGTKTRYEASEGRSFPVPSNYCSAAFSRNKPFCSCCHLKPCIMRVNHDMLSQYCLQLEISGKPKGFIKKKAEEVVRDKLVSYFGKPYFDSLPGNGIPACFYRNLCYLIDSDTPSGDESDCKEEKCVLFDANGRMELK